MQHASGIAYWTGSLNSETWVAKEDKEDGYVEFEDLDGLKDALTKSGSVSFVMFNGEGTFLIRLLLRVRTDDCWG